ncbi:Type 1 glutamine amidotransferase-like domain-containing protein [Streptomyces sp. NPDC021224]|uniref:Type 1 glutamine amidotransferase-like domain-containing protein n=1 Tax=unclassified Streptomyces TaxID=2593676 RepID=UPI0037A43488
MPGRAADRPPEPVPSAAFAVGAPGAGTRTAGNCGGSGGDAALVHLDDAPASPPWPRREQRPPRPHTAHSRTPGRAPGPPHRRLRTPDGQPRGGLADLLLSLHDTVWVGLSAGSMVMTPRIGADFVEWKPPTGGDETLGVVGFSLFPHLDHPALPENTMADAERWAAALPNPAYAIDDDTAVKVTDGAVEIVSEGHWRLF